MKEKGGQKQGKGYEFACDTDSDDDDGELSDMDDKKYKGSTQKVPDDKDMRGTVGMGGLVNIDQNKAVETGKAQFLQKQEEENNRMEQKRLAL